MLCLSLLFNKKGKSWLYQREGIRNKGAGKDVRIGNVHHHRLLNVHNATIKNYPTVHVKTAGTIKGNL